MTPSARLAAAIEILDRILAGTGAGQVLTDWGRGNRYAGSGDRAAIRDLVYDALRCRRSFAWAGGAETGRGLMLGYLRLNAMDPATMFTGERFAPEPPAPDEGGRPPAEAPRGVRLDLPDWLVPRFDAALGDVAESVADTLRHRAPVWLRVNRRRATVAEAAQALAAEDIGTRPHPDINFALEVTGNGRKIRNSIAWTQGLIELQDASSQGVIAHLGDLDGLEVLDYCAGGGGKALQMADMGARVTAHDADPRRMRDIAPRAERAGVRIVEATTGALAGRLWPLVVLDAPCSGSGTWRRDPEGKWALTEARLDELQAIQDGILDAAAELVAPGGRLAWITCSLLPEENLDRTAAFLRRHPGWREGSRQSYLPGPLGDGFSVVTLLR